MSLLQLLPAPLVTDIVENRCLPIIGAGFSRNAVLPAGLTMPLWKEFGSALAADLPDFPEDETSPLEAISAYEHEYGRPRLIDEVRRLLHHGIATPGGAHREFCRLPFDFVCTTNADCLLEQGYDLVSREYRVIVEEEQLGLGVGGRTLTLLKLHGDINHPRRLVISEDDYDRFLVANPLIVTFLSNLLITRTALFVGYSLEDPDFRQILAVISDRLGRLRRQAYVLTHRASAHERRRYERRHVKCIDLG